MATDPPVKIVLPPGVQALIDYCEKICVAGCCGLDAFDFSPLHVASYLSAYKGEITSADLAEWENALTAAEAMGRGLVPNADGYICVVEALNTYFTPETFRGLIGDLRFCIELAPQVFQFSKRLCQGFTPEQAGQTVAEDLQRKHHGR